MIDHNFKMPYGKYKGNTLKEISEKELTYEDAVQVSLLYNIANPND